jgi:hypothetical protein
MKIAAVVDDLTLSQSSFYMIKSFNELGKKLDNQPFCFYQNLSSRPIKPLFSICHVYYASYFYNGMIIATNFNTLRTLKNIHTNSKKYFYVWDLEWLRDEFDYMKNVELMRDENITLIARSLEHSNIIGDYCNRSVMHVVEDWDSKKLEKLWTQKKN